MTSSSKAFSSEPDAGSHIDLDVSIDRHRCENATILERSALSDPTGSESALKGVGSARPIFGPGAGRTIESGAARVNRAGDEREAR
jgi:hypothetical protein